LLPEVGAVELAQLIAYLIAAGLLALGLGFGWQQYGALRRAAIDEHSAADRRYLRRQAWLRLVGCGGMLVLGLMVAGTYASGQEARAAALGKLVSEQRQRGAEVTLTPEQQAFRRTYGAFWIAVLLLLLLVVLLAAVDIWGIRRWHRRKLAELQADRREAIEEQVAIMRSKRNGQPTNGHSTNGFPS